MRHLLGIRQVSLIVWLVAVELRRIKVEVRKLQLRELRKLREERKLIEHRAISHVAHVVVIIVSPSNIALIEVVFALS